MNPSPDDDERTVINSGVPSGAPTPTTPPSSTLPDPAWHDSHALPLGTRLGEFELIEKIGEGGFSIVYLALDHSLERQVALKEYMPSALASRSGGTHVNPRSERQRETFDAGLRSFINEAKLLAHFDHRSLVKVYRFWEAHGTAYMVMPFYRGVTLRDTVRALPKPPDEAWIRALLAPLTDALLVIHADHCYHRDVAPDNIMLLADSGAPLLLDFGAARRVIGDMTHALTVILKPGYAPIEQYAEIPGMQQGAWTDVYALAAVVYWMITGKTPPASAGRLVQDSYVPLVECAAGRYGLPFLQAIDRALIVLPGLRTQSIEALRLELGTGLPAGNAPPTDEEATVIRSPVPMSVAKPLTHAPLVTAPAPPPPEPADMTGPRRGRAIFVASGAGALVIAASAWWFLDRPASPVAPPPPVLAPASAAPTPLAAPPALPVPPAPEAASAVLPAIVPKPLPSTRTSANDLPAPVPAHVERKPSRMNKVDPPKAAEHRADPNPNAAECARIMQRLSLGESNAALFDRVKTLNCR